MTETSAPAPVTTAEPEPSLSIGQRIVAVTNSGADSSGTMSLRCFDAKTFAQIGGPYTFTPPTNTNSPFATGLTPWNPAGVVVRTFANTLLFMPHVLRDIGCR